MMTPRNHNPEPIATFEVILSSKDIDQFFEAVGWKLATRPENPPTLATMFREGEFKAIQTLAIPLHEILHVEQKYRFQKPLIANEKYIGQTSIESQFEKSGTKGSTKFFTFQTDLRDASGELCVECLVTIVHRQVKPA